MQGTEVGTAFVFSEEAWGLSDGFQAHDAFISWNTSAFILTGHGVAPFSKGGVHRWKSQVIYHDCAVPWGQF